MRKLYLVAVLITLASCGPDSEHGQDPGMHTQEQSLTSGCYVTVFCSDSTSRSCSGTSTCSASQTGNPPSVTCDGVSSYCSPPAPTSCTIGGVTYSAGTVNSSNICLECDPARSTTSWSNRYSFWQTNTCRPLGLCGGGACLGMACDENADCHSECLNGQLVCAGPF